MLSTGPVRPETRRRPIVRWDAALSGAALVVTGMLVALGIFGAVFLVAFFEYCPPRTCSSSAVLVSVGGSLVVAAAAGVAGLAMTVLRVVERRPAWPFALATLAVAASAVAFGAVHYASAIGY
ncbi:hypothetical protein Ae406Ps2_1769c [Pseudonocardia sp. Ae406_Ps2]|uniref:hypothetical protein n=1 Tax=unclassified Pseudonocardia TaxID=2619320 RepID=UPI00030DAD43|nr:MULTISPECIES: hypothetical protein [unclassified Pseudonocardia]OLM01769.1 hypothetical protein Ae406Ps2_1769c [Pseudonocardia sp. Ae406_Ps2]OLM06449.1 hypothetical protein Ae331Ps2_4159 [Pseudonocardia sp. Ae331_Ps2]OLM13186.1 hypothetical protein Ae505Ps2_3314 [Pseudonocardia sp. Ae505_Ps2]OLM23340.1 hypothetical protein Ae706Ps2_1773c [Pseudonocardia sp. Ae706_Ps2]OLM32395.1 hypothetical protein Ae717Ps2_3290c [Pseudonocardia sp. Ae717_Ps2]